jgi:hypothetical protein
VAGPREVRSCLDGHEPPDAGRVDDRAQVDEGSREDAAGADDADAAVLLGHEEPSVG